MTNPVKLGSVPGCAFSRRFFRFVLILLPLLLPVPLHAAPTVAAAYQQAGGDQLTVELRIGSPPPSSLILVQQLPPGVKLLAATPPANNVNTGKGEVKWLLRDIKAGTLVIRMTLDRAISTDQVAGEIRYKSSRGDGMETLPIAQP